MTTSLIWAMAGFAAGALLVWFYHQLRAARWNSSEKVLNERLSNQEEIVRIERAGREKIENEFRLAASDALRQTAEQFLTTAIRDLRQVKTETDLSVERKKDEITSSVSDMKSRLDEYQQTVRRFEAERHEMYGKLEKQLGQVLSAEQSIRMETSALKRVLTSSSGVRGKWGEKILLEILEQNDFVRGLHFDTQVVVAGSEGGDLRPDFVINLSSGKKLIIDSKEVAGEYVLAQETDDPDQQKEHYQKLVANIRSHFIQLSRKEYQMLLDPDIPFVVMFIPSEAAIRAAFATDPGIFQEASERRVVLASPMTIIPLIYLVKHNWQQHHLAENARELGVGVEELGNRLFKFMDHLQNLRSGIRKTAESWDKAAATWKSRVSPQMEKVKSLGGKLKDAEDLEPLDGSAAGKEEIFLQ